MHAIPKPVLNTAPTADSTFLSVVKTYLKIDNTSDDALIAALILAATQRLESETGKKFLTQKWDIYYDYFPTKYNDKTWWDGTKEMAISELYGSIGSVDMPFGICSAITNFKTYGTDDTEFIFDSSNYQLDNAGPRGRIGLRIGCVWPVNILRPFNGIKLEGCTFGYGNAYANIPADLAEAVKLTVAALYENRGDGAVPNFTIPMTALALIQPYVVIKL